jgi:transcriptional regulator with XRE-family HTH domain
MGLRKNPSLASLQGLAKALGVSLDDLLTDPREKLRRLKSAEVLREAALGGRTREWFEGALPNYPDPFVAGATKLLEKAGLIAKTGDGRTYRATDEGRAVLKRNRLDAPDWIVRAALVNIRK